MTARLHPWPLDTVEAGVLIAGFIGMLDGLRAVATVPRILTQEFSVVVFATLAPMYLAALFFAPIVLVLRAAFGSLVIDTDVNGHSSAARFLAASSIVAICASVVGVMLVNLSSLWMYSAPPVIQSAIASGATLVVFASERRLIFTPAEFGKLPGGS